MQRRTIGYLLSILLFFGAFAIGVAQELPQEYTSVFTDRDLCLSGERVAFSAYHVQSSPTELPLSATMYVELLDAQGEAVLSQKCRIREGRCRGILEIPSNSATGVYFLRAYSQYQRNNPPESHATTVLTIVNPDESVQPNPVPRHSKLESCMTWMGGQRAQLVLKAPFDIPSPDSISIRNPQGQTKGRVLQHIGAYCLVELDIDPKNGYEVLIHNGDRSQTYPLETKQPGLAVEMNRISANSLQVRCESPKDLLPKSELVLLVTGRNFHPLYQQKHRLNEGVLEVKLNALPRAARYLFVQSPDGSFLAGAMLPDGELPQPEMNLSASKLGPRQTAALSIGTEKLAGMNVSVSKAIPFPAEYYLDLVWANPWLVEQLPIPDSLKDFASILQRDFLQKKATYLLKERKPDFPPESRDLGISGRVLDSKTREAATDVLAVLSVIGEDPQIHPCRTDSTGHFRVALHNLKGMETVFIGVQEGEKQDLELIVNQDFRPEVPEIRPVPLRYDSTFHKSIEGLFISKQVMDRYRELPREELLPAQPIPALPVNVGKPDISIVVEEYVALESVEEIITNIVPWVGVQRTKGKPYISVYEERSLMTHRNPLILLDYAVVFDIEAFLKLSPRKLERFDVYTGSYFIGDERFDGMLAVFSNTNNFAGYPFSNYGAFVRYATLQPTLAVPAVNHESSAWPKNLPDFRSVLYWNPHAGTSNKVQAGDQAGTYRVRLAGMRLDGSVFREEKQIEVVGRGE